MTASPLLLDEPLAELANFAFDWAHCLCHPQAGCLKYHRAWSIVRHIETGGALPAGQAFFGKALRDLARDGRIRILLSGSADTGLAAMVLQTLRPHGIEPQLILVDRCLTTIEQNRLFARHAGFDLQTIHADATTLEIAPVDAIIVHSFLGFFAPELRQRVVDMWSRNLVPHGRILISNRMSLGKPALRRLPGAEELAERRAALAAKAIALGYSPARVADITDAAQDLWMFRSGHAQIGESELLGLLENAGLLVVEMHKDTSTRSVSPIFLQSEVKRRIRGEFVVAHARKG